MNVFIQNLRQAQQLVYAFVIAWLVPLATNFAGSILEEVYGERLADRIQLFALLLALIIGLTALAWFALPAKRRILTTDDDPRPQRHAGLIVSVGIHGTRDVDPSTLSHISAIEYHLNNEEAGGVPLRVCWLLASEAAIDNANDVKQQYEDRCTMIVKRIPNAFNVQDTYNVVRTIYEAEAAANHIAPENVLADLTGGTKPISIGMALATQNHYPMQYVYGGRKDIASEPVLMSFRGTDG